MDFMLDVPMAAWTLNGWLQGLTPGDWVDIGCLAAAILSIGIGACRGLSGELPIGAGWICGLGLGWYTYRPAHSFFSGLAWFQPHPRLAEGTALAAMILLSWGIAILVRAGLAQVAKSVAKQPADAILGALAGAFRIALILLLATGALLLAPWPVARETVCHHSRTGRFLANYATDVVITVSGMLPKLDIPESKPVHLPPGARRP